mmetsp:Transcript_43814/g.102281  ORF Transcript_43814/g.102281 Transcript_43814/m.102281 type:complete len:241 (-) Transcript_43814:132-854(-)
MRNCVTMKPSHALHHGHGLGNLADLCRARLTRLVPADVGCRGKRCRNATLHSQQPWSGRGGPGPSILRIRMWIGCWVGQAEQSMNRCSQEVCTLICGLVRLRSIHRGRAWQACSVPSRVKCRVQCARQDRSLARCTSLRWCAHGKPLLQKLQAEQMTASWNALRECNGLLEKCLQLFQRHMHRLFIRTATQQLRVGLAQLKMAYRWASRLLPEQDHLTIDDFPPPGRFHAAGSIRRNCAV